jgi:hypothetical protein
MHCEKEKKNTFFMMASSFKALAASTAFGVRFGWADNDCKNVLSCSVGRKGSVGHDAAIVLSFCDILEVDMIELKEPACESIGSGVNRPSSTPPIRPWRTRAGPG